MKSSGRHVSMDAPFVQGEGSNLYDVLENGIDAHPDLALLDDSLRQEVARALQSLTPREQEVIGLYFGLAGGSAMTLEEIGESFSLTRERVRQIKEKAIRRLIRRNNICPHNAVTEEKLPNNNSFQIIHAKL